MNKEWKATIQKVAERLNHFNKEKGFPINFIFIKGRYKNEDMR